tara:strand:+ start:7 stop:282 length:276 start_codon:yes stop_codon:yes gene_type:complete
MLSYYNKRTIIITNRGNYKMKKEIITQGYNFKYYNIKINDIVNIGSFHNKAKVITITNDYIEVCYKMKNNNSYNQKITLNNLITPIKEYLQ